MSQANSQSLSASLEDYLEAIFNVADNSGIARSKDIAKSLNVAKSSVTGALRHLAEKGLVNYQPYNFITLTEDGKKAAAAVTRKHNILKSFFVNVLGIDVDKAQLAACKAEHTLGPEIIARLLCFIEFATRENKDSEDLAKKFGEFCKKQGGKELFRSGSKRNMEKIIGLDRVEPGQKGRIVKILGRSGINRRIADMGVVPGTVVEVKRVAPLGDPIDIKLKGYHLSLRKEDASKITVELTQ